MRPGSGHDPFVDPSGRPRVLRAAYVMSNAPRLAELAGRVGFDAVWIDVEHGPIGYGEVEALCMAVEAGGALPVVRIPNNHREHVLRALESGARILVVPMIESAEEAARIVEHGKFPPLGRRGYNTLTRGCNYGLEEPLETLRRADERTHLFAQIETVAAVRNVEAICRVEGLAGILVGPGDLSQSAGKTARYDDPELLDMVVSSIRCARKLGKHAGLFALPGPILDAGIAAGCDLVIAGGDILDLVTSWRALLESLEKKLGARRGKAR